MPIACLGHPALYAFKNEDRTCLGVRRQATAAAAAYPGRATPQAALSGRHSPAVPPSCRCAPSSRHRPEMTVGVGEGGI